MSVSDAAPTFSRPRKPRKHVPGQLVVRFKPEALAAAAAVPVQAPAKAKLDRLPEAVEEPLSYLRRNAGLRSVEPVFASMPSTKQKPAERDRLAAIASVRDVDEVGAGTAVFSLPDKRITKKLVNTVTASPAVEIAEPMPARWLYAAVDPEANLQWGLPAIRFYQTKRPAAKRVQVGILDTGIDTNHPDLPDPALYNRGGYGKKDLVGHGTHVAGVIAAVTNNVVGISGICDCELAVWKVFPDDPRDPYLDSAAYLRALGEVAGEGVDVVNLSLGGEAHSQVEEGLFERAIKQGVTFVAAMGNEYEEGNPTSYPAAYHGVISVGAVDETRGRSGFSSTGNHIDLSAPGSNILSTLPTTKSSQRSETNYGAWSGTSMATPHVTAAAALLKAKQPGWAADQITQRLRKSAAAVPAMKGTNWNEEFGSGLLDLGAALR